jgi:hypothetical protein
MVPTSPSVTNCCGRLNFSVSMAGSLPGPPSSQPAALTMALLSDMTSRACQSCVAAAPKVRPVASYATSSALAMRATSAWVMDSATLGGKGGALPSHAAHVHTRRGDGCSEAGANPLGPASLQMWLG